MPCTDGIDNAHTLRQSLAGANARIDSLARLLCHVMTRVEAVPTLYREVITTPIDGEPPAALDLWWQRHKAADARRIAAEAAAIEQASAKAAALAKLTPEERRLLGLREVG